MDFYDIEPLMTMERFHTVVMALILATIIAALVWLQRNISRIFSDFQAGAVKEKELTHHERKLHIEREANMQMMFRNLLVSYEDLTQTVKKMNEQIGDALELVEALNEQQAAAGVRYSTDLSSRDTRIQELERNVIGLKNALAAVTQERDKLKKDFDILTESVKTQIDAAVQSATAPMKQQLMEKDERISALEKQTAQLKRDLENERTQREIGDKNRREHTEAGAI